MPEMQSKKLAGNKPTESTQKYLDIAEIKENTILLKDGSLRVVVAVSSTNFSLKSEDEQNAISSSYQSFLNSLDFPIQILIQSRVLDINIYLEKLRVLESTQSNELLRIQMNEYIEFVGKLVEFASIMKKSFYVVVPYSGGASLTAGGLVSRIKKIFNPAITIAANREGFDQAQTKLEERVLHVVSGLSTMGLRSIRLNTEELIELMYHSYNFESGTPLYAGSLEELDIQEDKSNKEEMRVK